MMSYFMVEIFLPEEMDESFFNLIPRHRAVVNHLIEQGIISSYSIDRERSRGWIMFKAQEEDMVISYLRQFPIYKMIKCKIHPLFIADGEVFRLPKLHLN
jgi:muconolactone delta-isomerase